MGGKQNFLTLLVSISQTYTMSNISNSCKNLKGGLQEVADSLEVERIGPQHQAGSDSLLTGMAFFRMIEVYFEDDLDDPKYLGHLYGLGTPGQPASASPSADEAAKIEES